MLIVLSLLLSANRAVAQDAGSPSIEAIINKLRSASFQERQAATEALKKRPDAAPALREAPMGTNRKPGDVPLRIRLPVRFCA